MLKHPLDVKFFKQGKLQLKKIFQNQERQA